MLESRRGIATPGLSGLMACAVLLAAGPGLIRAEELGVKVPAGFEVVEFAGDELAHDIYSMTIDSKGRVVVSGAGYIKILVDRDGDGKADEAKLFSSLPRNGAQGLAFVGRSLICIGDGGLLRFRDANGDDQADGPPEVFLKTKTGGEHDVHSIQQGPDGWWYVIAGNNAGISSAYVTLPESPIKSPRAGVILRLKPDLSGAEILAHGLRNAYDFAFHSSGDLFTYDSDEEREVSLPWYRPTRVFQVLPGSDHGWVSKSSMRAGTAFDMPPQIASFGRGSPTGTVCYRHTQFPAEFHDALFVLDWTYGRVHMLPLRRTAETWTAEPALFMSAVGQHGFAPTDAEVGPDGSLYVSVGGRGTRGGVYRIQHRAGLTALSEKSSEPAADPIATVLNAPQPLSSWSRANWVPTARSLGADAFRAAARDGTRAVSERRRAIEVLTEVFAGIDLDTANDLSKSTSAEVRARTAWACGRAGFPMLPTELLTRFLDDPDPIVRRAGLETCLVARPGAVAWSELVPPLARCLGCDDRYNRWLAALTVRHFEESQLPALSGEATRVSARAVIAYAHGWLRRPGVDPARIQQVVPAMATAVLKSNAYDLPLKRDAVRLLQRALGDVGPSPRHVATFDSYASQIDLEPLERDLDPLRSDLAPLFPTGDATLDRELLRLLAMITTFHGPLVDAIAAQLTKDSDPIEDIHRLAVLARFPMIHSVKQREAIAAALVALESKVEDRGLAQDASWSDRIKDIWVAMALADDYLAAALVGHPDFGRPGHTVFLNQMNPGLLPAARAAFVKQIAATDEYAWTNEVVFALGNSDEPAHRLLVRSQFDRFAVRGAVLVTLSRKPSPADRDLFVQGLDWSQTEVLAACLAALKALGPADQPAEQLALLKSLRRLHSDEREYGLRETVVDLLERNTGQKFPFVRGPEGRRPQTEAVKAWTDWCLKTWPVETARELGDQEGQRERLDAVLQRVDWTKGDLQRGAAIFARRACVQCHSRSGALGPDLAGAATRFSKHDLFTAIEVPSRDVSARYQTTLVETKDGKSYSGLVIYESVDGFLIRNGTGQTFRIETSQVDEKRKSPVSLMPTGLLKDFSDQDYADLYAYLQSLGAGR